MSVHIDGDRIRLTGVCDVAEAELLLAALTNKPDRVIVLEAAQIHTALWQVMLAAKPKIEGQPADSFVAAFLSPLMHD